MRENQYGLRLVFDSSRDAIYNACVEAGMDPVKSKAAVDNAVLSQSYLSLEQPIVAGTTQYNFPILSNQGGPQTATEQRLALQDAFYACEAQLLVGVRASATDTAFKLYSYGSPTIFTGSDSTSLNNLYNGKMIIAVNNSVIMPAWDLLKHEVINQTQETAATNSPLDQIDYGADGAYVMQPNLVFIGSKNTQIQLSLPGNIANVLTNSFIMLRFRGVLAQNVTVVS